MTARPEGTRKLNRAPGDHHHRPRWPRGLPPARQPGRPRDWIDARAVPADLADPHGVATVADALARAAVHVLVNDAGVGGH